MSAAYQNAGTVTGAALDFVRTSVLVPAAGYRGLAAVVNLHQQTLKPREEIKRTVKLPNEMLQELEPSR